MKKYLIVILVIFLASCAHRNSPEYQQRLKEKAEITARAQNMIVATSNMVEGCQYINEVECSTKRRRGYQRCKKNLKMQAAKLGATHIIWTAMMSEGGKTFITGLKGNMAVASSKDKVYVSGMTYKCK